MADDTDRPKDPSTSTTPISADDFQDTTSRPTTPISTTEQSESAGQARANETKGTSPNKEEPAASVPPLDSQPPHHDITAPTASTSSLNLPLSHPQPILDPPGVANDELVASLRSQVTDLTSQVTSLNSKLVKSYTTRGELEDDLHDKEEAEQRLKRRVAELEVDKHRWEKEIEQGGWVEKNHVQGEMQRLMTKVVEETKSRESAVQAHSALETEIENLTSNLFTEANKMVAFERLSRARAEEKTRSVEEAGVSMQALLEEVQVGLKDTIGKLEKRDAEIIELKKRLAAHGEHVEEDIRDGRESADGDVGGIMFSDGEHLTPLDTKALSRSTLGQSASPSHLSAPRLLTSVLPYHEFLNFITYLRQLRVTALSRPPEGPGYPHPLVSARGFANDASTIQLLTPAQLLAPHLLLSTHLSQPFLKRCVEEDSDPALRLDIAPGLGFLSRRAVGSAIVDGSLLIEPLHAGVELSSDKCALCGCSLEMWLPNSGHPARGKPTTGVNQTMRKMLPSSLFSRSNSSSSTSFSTSQPSASTYHSASSSADSFTFPAPHEKASHHPHDASLQVHLCRASDSASQRYPVCPSYCLTRLRAVCEFWTYVRVIERGLLLEEGFKFGQGGREGGAPTLSRQASFVHGSGAAPSPAEQASAGLGLGPVGSGNGEHADVEAKDFEAEDTEDGPGSTPSTGKTFEVEGKKGTPTIVEPQEGDLGEVTGEGKGAEEQREGQTQGGHAGSASSTPDRSTPAGDLGSVASSSTTSLSKPVRPARSAARTSPAIGTNPSPPSSPRIGAPPSLPPRRVTPGPPPRHPSAVSTGLSVSTSSSTGPPGGDIVGSAIGWEDRCWSEVVRLKESVFWARVAAIAPDGGTVVGRGAKVWLQ
ncbi:hypothetical protein JCM11641_005873 [Rhodosporidiobolus odoratus]